MKYILIALMLTACTESDLNQAHKDLKKAQDAEFFIVADTSQCCRISIQKYLEK